MTENLAAYIDRARLNLHDARTNENYLSESENRELSCFRCFLASKIAGINPDTPEDTKSLQSIPRISTSSESNSWLYHFLYGWSIGPDIYLYRRLDLHIMLSARAH